MAVFVVMRTSRCCRFINPYKIVRLLHKKNQLILEICIANTEFSNVLTMDQNNKNKRKISDEEENSLKRTKIDEEKGLEDVLSGFQQISVKRKAEDSLENPIKVRKLETSSDVPNLKYLILNNLRDPEIFQSIINNSNDDGLLKLEENFPEYSYPMKNNKSMEIVKHIVNFGEYKNVWERGLERKTLKDVLALANDVQAFFKTAEFDKLEIGFNPFILKLESKEGNVSINVCLQNKFASMQKMF